LTPAIDTSAPTHDKATTGAMRKSLIAALETTFRLEDAPVTWDYKQLQTRARMRCLQNGTTEMGGVGYGLSAVDEHRCFFAYQRHLESSLHVQEGVGFNTGTALPFLMEAESALLGAAAGGGRDAVDTGDAKAIASAEPQLAPAKLSLERSHLAYAGPAVNPRPKLAVDMDSSLGPATVAMNSMFTVASRRLRDGYQPDQVDASVDIVVPYTLVGMAQLLGASVGAQMAFQCTPHAYLVGATPIPLIQGVVDLPHDHTEGSRVAWAMVDSLHKLAMHLPHVQLFTRPPRGGRLAPSHPLLFMDCHRCLVLMNYIPRLGGPRAATNDRASIIATSNAIIQLKNEAVVLPNGFLPPDQDPLHTKAVQYNSARNMVIALIDIYEMLTDEFFKASYEPRSNILAFIRVGTILRWADVLTLTEAVGRHAGVPGGGEGKLRLAVIEMQLMVDRRFMMSMPVAEYAMHPDITIGI
jgi:hypothetical protein